jgi:uncharacterized protein YifN (PemK superfamily)
MSLKFPPRPGTVLVCDFSGFTPPEICKIRPVVVVAPRLPYRDELATVVPLSTTAPCHNHPFCVKLERNYTPWDDAGKDSWAKADLMISVSLARLDGFKIGKRKWDYPQVSAADLVKIKEGVLHSIGMGHLLGQGNGVM